MKSDEKGGGGRMKEEKVVALITAAETTKKELCSQLSSLLDGYMRVEGYATDEGIQGVVKADLIVLSSSWMVDMVTGYLDPNCPVIVANRSLNMEHLDRLFHIPKDVEVLIVNDELETAVEIIDLLKEIGIDYLRCIPYSPGHRIIGNPMIAITPGESKLVPSHIEKIIDIGPRIIDITTVIEILRRLDLIDEKSRFISGKYMETIVKLNKQLYDTIEKVDQTNNFLGKVLHQVNDGIIVITNEGSISVFNKKSEEFFGVKASFVIGENINRVIRNKNLCSFLMEKTDIGNQLFKVNDTELMISKFRIETLQSIVCTIINTKETMDMEKKLRQKLIKMGHIGKYHFHNIIGKSPVIQDAIETAQKLAKTDLNILIYGESGVGKELFASAIHNQSARSAGPFLAVNFSSLSEELAESELFGYEEGAFTGAKKGGSIGLFEQASGGTIFLDEIGDVSLRIQARLLRVLQEKQIRRVGGTEIIPVDVRVIAATNKNLGQMCKEALFREDLYHRLKKLYLKIPPLRERLEDIDDLIQHFAHKNGRADIAMTGEVVKILKSVRWNGNIRELENTVDYLLAVSDGKMIDVSHLPHDFLELQKDELEIKEPHMVDVNHYHRDHYTDALCERGNLKEFHFILKILYEGNESGTTVSRRMVSELAKDQFPTLSADKVRRRADILQQVGLIYKTYGRGGMRLTQEGIRYVNQMGKIGQK